MSLKVGSPSFIFNPFVPQSILVRHGIGRGDDLFGDKPTTIKCIRMSLGHFINFRCELTAPDIIRLYLAGLGEISLVICLASFSIRGA